VTRDCRLHRNARVKGISIQVSKFIIHGEQALVEVNKPSHRVSSPTRITQPSIVARDNSIPVSCSRIALWRQIDTKLGVFAHDRVNDDSISGKALTTNLPLLLHDRPRAKNENVHQSFCALRPVWPGRHVGNAD
jgi:hypothetical protein